jgi:hypothetical protein
MIPALPNSFSRPDLENVGFLGWKSWAELRADEFRQVPGGPTVYVVFRPRESAPVFLDASPGGRFKERDPSVDPAVLHANWVSDARVVYIGKANVGNRRLKQYARFGAGEPVGHWGGRYIWQLADADKLLVAWHAITWDEKARDYEKRLLEHFAALHGGARPFANLTG